MYKYKQPYYHRSISFRFKVFRFNESKVLIKIEMSEYVVM